MEGKIKLWIVMATWLLGWSIMFGWARESPDLPGKYTTTLLMYPTSYFTTQKVTTGSYQEFVRSLRRDLSSDAESYGVRLLRTKSQATGDKEYVYVLLSSSTIKVRLALYAVNAYVIGYEVDGRSYFFNEAPPGSQNKLFDPKNKKTNVKLSTNYNHLPNREKIRIGFKELDGTLSTLQSFDSEDPTNDLKTALVIIIQMVAEAARNKYIENKLAWKNFDGFYPKGDVISFENKWEDISKAFQNSKDGTISPPIVLQNEDYSPRPVSNVADVKEDMALLLASSTKASLEQTTGHGTLIEEY